MPLVFKRARPLFKRRGTPGVDLVFNVQAKAPHHHLFLPFQISPYILPLGVVLIVAFSRFSVGTS